MCLFLYINWLTDFNALSSIQGLFYAKKLGSRVHCMFVYTFPVLLLRKILLTHGPIEYEQFLTDLFEPKILTLAVLEVFIYFWAGTSCPNKEENSLYYLFFLIIFFLF